MKRIHLFSMLLPPHIIVLSSEWATLPRSTGSIVCFWCPELDLLKRKTLVRLLVCASSPTFDNITETEESVCFWAENVMRTGGFSYGQHVDECECVAETCISLIIFPALPARPLAHIHTFVDEARGQQQQRSPPRQLHCSFLRPLVWVTSVSFSLGEEESARGL